MLIICGVEKVDYTNKAGKRVEGYRFHCMEEVPEVIGRSVISEYIPKTECLGLLTSYDSLEDVLGLSVRFVYNRYGRCVGLEEVK